MAQATLADVASAAAWDSDTKWCSNEEDELEEEWEREHLSLCGHFVYLRPAVAALPTCPVHTDDKRWDPAVGADGIRQAAADRVGGPLVLVYSTSYYYMSCTVSLSFIVFFYRCRCAVAVVPVETPTNGRLVSTDYADKHFQSKPR